MNFQLQKHRNSHLILNNTKQKLELLILCRLLLAINKKNYLYRNLFIIKILN